MSPTPQTVVPGRPVLAAPREGGACLNAYEILNANCFAWDVNVYSVAFSDSSRHRHESRGVLKDIFWSLWKEHRIQWRGPSLFVLDLNPHEVAVPGHWKLPSPYSTPDYRVSLARSFRAHVGDCAGRVIVAGILREGIKRHFKENGCQDLGDLWQDYDSFCQNPVEDLEEEYLLCRRFGFQVKVLDGGILAVQCFVGTTTVTDKR